MKIPKEGTAINLIFLKFQWLDFI